VTSVTLEAADAAFLAARLRRLFAFFNYSLPSFAADDARLIGIAGSAIGAVLTRHETPCDMGAICIGCTPRRADGDCPGKGNAGVTGHRGETFPRQPPMIQSKTSD
jgi:hypothetical protein